VEIFFGKTLRPFYFNREEKVLSSIELVNAAGVVQEQPPALAKTDPKLPHDVIYFIATVKNTNPFSSRVLE